MFISGIYSLADEMNEAESGLSTSAVDIELKEYNYQNELFVEDGRLVSPGEEIILIPRVHNLGIDCYLRAKITYTVNSETINVLDYIEGNYSSWTKNGEYYYYESVLDKAGSVDLFQKVVIPDYLSSSSYQGARIVIHIVVEAIQAKNFDGDWEGIEIQESVDRTYDIDYDGESSIIYEDDVHRHITLDDHFFDNLGNLLPGDSLSEDVQILNKSNSKNEYFLSIDYHDLSDTEKNLLRRMKLTIKNHAGEILVSSNLEDKHKHSLGVLSPGKGDKITITLSLPIDIDNEYSKLFTKIIWKFSYDVLDHHENIPINPNTWDLKFDLSITVFILSTIGFLVVLFVGKFHTDDIEKKIKKEGKKL